MYNVIIQYPNSLLLCSIRNLTLASLSRLFTIKSNVFPLFISFDSHSGLFYQKAITENQLHDFLINSRHSCRKYCSHMHIIKDHNHRRSLDKIWAQKVRLFR